MSDFHGVNMVGPFNHERLTSRPVWSTSDIGREIYVTIADSTYGGKFWKGTDNEWVEVLNGGNVNITGGSITGITDLSVADGGTGASTASQARANLGCGTAAQYNVGTAANNIVQLDANGNLPAIDGSQLTNLPISATVVKNLLGMDKLMANSGYMMLDGLMYQWGRGTTSGGCGSVIIFPTTFPNSCYVVIPTIAPNTYITYGVSDMTNSNFTMKTLNVNEWSCLGYHLPVYYIAIGS